KKNKIVVMTVNRPEALNSLDPETMQELSEAFIDFRDDPSLWVAIITGAGDRAFSAGADLRKTIPLYGDTTRDPLWEPPPTIMRGLEVWKPFIAAINGMALGGGCELALACDLRIASENATFGQTEVRWGLAPGWGATQRLARAVPLAVAAELILTAKTMDAQEAYRVGLVNKVVPQSQLLPTAMEWAENICQLGPLGVRAAKEAMLKGLGMPLNDGLILEQSLFNTLRRTEDFAEGPRAFAEKRPAKFQGR
ncbi:MAG: enoyl-CoA hydratase/isomerase family protein, partial [Chloroflexi bacterium]|nr:enoyl-CoA hydratase/isomerase family protein [Chloroflexota bacterium]